MILLLPNYKIELSGAFLGDFKGSAPDTPRNRNANENKHSRFDGHNELTANVKYFLL